MTTGRINQVNWVGCWVVELLLPPQYIYIYTSLSLSLVRYPLTLALLGLAWLSFALLCSASLASPCLGLASWAGLPCCPLS